jgi:hypothetical protein
MTVPRFMGAAIGVLVLAACGSAHNDQSSAAKTVPTTAAVTTSAPAATTTTTAVAVHAVEAFVAAFNRGDIGGAVSQYSTNALFFTPLGDCNPCVGRDVIRAKLSGAAAAQTQIEVHDPHVVGDTVTFASSIRSPQFPSGIERAIGTMTVEVHAGLITSAKQVYDLTDAQTRRLLESVGAVPTTTP